LPYHALLFLATASYKKHIITNITDTANIMYMANVPGFADMVNVTDCADMTTG